jgi:glyoxylate/hydroxypyruvate reductase A
MRSQDTVLDRVPVLIGVDLASEYVNQIWAVDPRIEVLYDPDLVGRQRFACDHHGPVERTPEQEARWLDLLARCEVLLGLGSCQHEGLLDLAPRLKWIQSTSAGVGQRAKKLGLTESGVLVTTASGIHATALAEFVLMAMLWFVKDGLYLAEEKKRKRWQRYTGGELRGQTVAVVGLGSIGQDVARLGRCLGMRVIGTKRNTVSVSPGGVGVEALYPRSELQTMLGKADFVVLSTPHTPETEGLIGEAEVKAMKPGGVLINIARGAVVDGEAMVRGLQSGHLGGAVLDVAAVEPLPASSPLWEMDNVLICPHSGSNVDSENRELTRLFCDNLRLYLAGEPLKNVLDERLLY